MEKSIGKKLENMWLEAGYTSLGEVHKASGITVATLSRIKNDIQKPTPGTLKKLSSILGVDHVELLKIAGHMSVDATPAVPQKEDKKPKDLQKILEQHDIMFSGTPLNDEDKQAILDIVELQLYKRAKELNKRKKPDSDSL